MPAKRFQAAEDATARTVPHVNGFDRSSAVLGALPQRFQGLPTATVSRLASNGFDR
jgi:hypothetical protein